MGCGPSKDANVATGNTMSTKSLKKKNSNDSSNSTTTSSTTTTTTTNNNNTRGDTDLKVDSGEENVKGSEDVQVKDTTPIPTPTATPTTAPEVEEGKFIAAGSPDPYFSSRKDEEAVTASAGYASPLSEIADEEKARVAEAISDAVNACGEELAAVTEVSGGNAEEAVVPKQEEGKSISKDSSDLKDTILVEEKETELNVDKQKNVGEKGESSTVAQ